MLSFTATHQILNLRLREVEQQRLREVELERQRQAEGRERLRALNAVQEEVLQLNQVLEASTPNHASHVLDMTSYSTRANQLCSQVSEVVRTTAEVGLPSHNVLNECHFIQSIIHFLENVGSARG